MSRWWILLLALLVIACSDDEETTPSPTGTGGTAGAGGVDPSGGGGAGATGAMGGGGVSAVPRLERDGRWLRYDGDWLYLVGVDMQSLVSADAWTDGADGYSGDYLPILDALAAARVNKVRLWANAWFITPDRLHSQPFARDADDRFDLEQWDDAYWTRLRDFVSECRDRSIMVEYCLFSQYADADMTDGTRASNYWASANNVNGAFDDTDAADGLYLEFFAGGGGQIDSNPISHFQDQLIDKAVEEIGEFGNVFFLVLNEPHTIDPAVFEWTRTRASALKAHDGGAHLVAVEVEPDPWAGPAGLDPDLQDFWNEADVDIMGGHAYDDDPASVSAKLHPAQDKNKILHDNEGFDLRSLPDQAAREAWGWAMAGGYYSFFTRDRDFNKVGDATWLEVIQVATTLRDVFESVRFWELSPIDANGDEIDGLVSQAPGGGGWQVLANPGQQYVVYTWGSPTTNALQIELPDGSYDYQWHDARTGALIGSGSVSGATPASLPAPATGDWSGPYGLAAVIRVP